MCKPHKHAVFIKAWADGKCIQQRWISEVWEDVPSYPSWHEGFEYRIKPEVIKYKRFLWKSSYRDKLVLTATIEEQQSQPREKWGSFVCWIDNDWIEQEV